VIHSRTPSVPKKNLTPAADAIRCQGLWWSLGGSLGLAVIAAAGWDAWHWGVWFSQGYPLEIKHSHGKWPIYRWFHLGKCPFIWWFISRKMVICLWNFHSYVKWPQGGDGKCSWTCSWKIPELVGALEHVDYCSIQLGIIVPTCPNWLFLHHFSEG